MILAMLFGTIIFWICFVLLVIVGAIAGVAWLIKKILELFD